MDMKSIAVSVVIVGLLVCGCSKGNFAEAAKPAAVQAQVGMAAIPAFPGAEGFGATATGGRGWPVYEVTTLEDYGPKDKPIPGSFRDAVSEPNRTVVFRVGGLITMKGNLAASGNLTIAGQTAPGEGIVLYGRGISLSGQNNIVIRYVRFRMSITGDRGKCSVRISKGSNMVLDHCSIEWGRWDSMGITEGSHDITVQNCIIGESIDPQRFGAIVDSVENVTLSRNLWIHNSSRNPKAKGTIQYINNVVYNYGGTGLAGGHSAADRELDVINNYFVAGPSSKEGGAIGGFAASDHVYQVGNLVDENKDGKLNGRAVVENDFKSEATFVTRSFLAPKIAVRVTSAEGAFEEAVAGAGASIHRDAVDARLAGDAASLGARGKIVHNEDEAGGQPAVKGGAAPIDGDHDGMPDAWEAKYGLNPKDPSDGAKDKDGDGYTNLEEYLNNTDPTKAIDYTKPGNNISSVGK
jgi:pectate lyase